MEEVDTLARAAQAALALKHAAREQALPKARATIRFCANAVRAIHRGEFAAASELLAEARNLLDDMRNTLHDHLDIYYAGFVADAQKEYAEAVATAAIIQGQSIPAPDELGVDWAPYLNGVGEAIGELRRHLLNEMRRGQIASCEAILSAMDDLFALITSLDFPDAITNNLRRTADVARGIIEKTRGDLTVAAVQARMSAQIAQLSAQLAGQGAPVVPEASS